MTLAYVALLVIGLLMIVAGATFVIRFAARHRLDERPPRPRPEGASGPVSTQRALLGALLVSMGFLLAVLGAVMLFVRPAA